MESVEEGCEKDRRAGRDQTWMLESEDPERRKLEVGSTARVVIDWRWDCEVDICRPVHSYTLC